jgi:chorismate lyase/3-hydroxybenzoate synthase
MRRAGAAAAWRGWKIDSPQALVTRARPFYILCFAMMQHALSTPLAFASPEIIRAGRDLAPPPWALALLGGEPQTLRDGGIERADSDRFSILTARVPAAADLAPDDLEARTADAYARIASELSRGPARYPARFWNHVPFITDPADAGRDNYMVFNAGRFRAFAEWFGSPAAFERSVATASGIGHWGPDLVIHCLASASPGAAVSNPRQVAPYHYSQRFGPVPPCFARATKICGRRTNQDGAAAGDSPDLLLVGGTASVRGEDSVHPDDLIAQCRETFVNLAALVAAAQGQSAPALGTCSSLKLPSSLKLGRSLKTARSLKPAPEVNPALSLKPAPAPPALTPPALSPRLSLKPPSPLAAFRELRVYHPDPADESRIIWMIRENFPALSRLELLPADLCRAELLVEIEGVAELNGH